MYVYVYIYIYATPLYTYLFGSMWSITKKRETRQAGGGTIYIHVYI